MIHTPRLGIFIPTISPAGAFFKLVNTKAVFRVNDKIGLVMSRPFFYNALRLSGPLAKDR